MRYFAYRVGLSGRLHFLTDEEGYFQGTCDGDGDEILSVWPLPEYIAQDIGKGETPCIATVELREFLDKYIQKFAKDDIYIGVFPALPSPVCKMKAEVFAGMMEEKAKELQKGEQWEQTQGVSLKAMKGALMASDEKRLKHFVNTVADSFFFWVDVDAEGNLPVSEDAHGNTYITVWPYRRYAEEVYQHDAARLQQLAKMEIHCFLKEYTEELAKNCIAIRVLPDAAMHSSRISAIAFRALMEEALGAVE